MANDTKPPVNSGNLSDGASSGGATNVNIVGGLDGLRSLLKNLSSGTATGGNLAEGAASAGAQLVGVDSSLGKIITSSGKVLKGISNIYDEQNKYQKAILGSILASEDLNKVSSQLGGLMTDAGMAGSNAMRETGQSMGQVAEGLQGLYKNSQNLAGGFKEMSIPDRLAAQVDLYSKAVQVARTTGLSFADMTSYSTKALEEHGEGLEDTLANLSMLREATAGSLNMGQASNSFSTLLGQTKNMDIDVSKLTKGFGMFIKAQKDMGDQGYSTWKSPQLAAAAYSNILGGVVAAQNDLSKSMFIASTTGGGLHEALEFMFEEDPTKNMEKMAESLRKTSKGGKIITKDEALNNRGLEGQYLAQLEKTKKMYGITSNQDAAKINDLQAAGKFSEAANVTSGDAKEEGKGALKDTLKLDDQVSKKLYGTSEHLNSSAGALLKASEVLMNIPTRKIIDNTVGSEDFKKSVTSAHTEIKGLRPTVDKATSVEGAKALLGDAVKKLDKIGKKAGDVFGFSPSPVTESETASPPTTKKLAPATASPPTTKKLAPATTSSSTTTKLAPATTSSSTTTKLAPLGMVSPDEAKNLAKNHAEQFSSPSGTGVDSGTIGDYSSLKLKVPETAVLKKDQKAQGKVMGANNKTATSESPSTPPPAAPSATPAQDESKYYADLNIKLVSTSGKELAAFVKKDLEVYFQRIKTPPV